jgi:hypothetical protein
MKTKNIRFHVFIVFALLPVLLLLSLGGCSHDPAPSDVEWISPMLSIEVSHKRAGVFAGDIPVEITNNDFGAENRGKIVTAIPEAGQPLTMARFTEQELMAAGAVKLTSNFAYEGDEEFNIRFRFRVDQFQGHNVTQYGLGAAAGVIILWRDGDGVWWNIRRTGWGGQFTGGTDTPGWFFPASHATLAGTHYPVFTFDINKGNARDFASQDFYLLFTEEVPFRVNDDGSFRDDQSGYVVTFQAELPDGDGHFHNFYVLSSASVYVHVPQTR